MSAASIPSGPAGAERMSEAHRASCGVDPPARRDRVIRPLIAGVVAMHVLAVARPNDVLRPVDAWSVGRLLQELRRELWQVGDFRPAWSRSPDAWAEITAWVATQTAATLGARRL